MHGYEQKLVEFLQQLFHTIGWPGVVVIMALESANIPIPSEVTMPLAGWMLAPTKTAAILWGGFYGALGCTIGSVISYAIGAFGGRPFLEKYGRYVLVTPHDIDRADEWFAKWGDATAFVSRMLPIVRTFISLPAGVAKMRFWTFTLYTFVGSFIWAGMLAFAGFEFGARWERIREIMRPFDIPIAIVLVVGFAFYVWHHVRHAQKYYREQEAAEK